MPNTWLGYINNTTTYSIFTEIRIITESMFNNDTKAIGWYNNHNRTIK